MSAAFPYLLAGSAGAYAAAIYAIFTGRWQAAVRPDWWLLLPAIVAFGVDRTVGALAFVAAPVTFVCCALLLVRMLSRAHAMGARGALWVLFAAVPLALAVVIVIGDFLPQHDASQSARAASWLLTLPGLAVFAAFAVRVPARALSYDDD